MDSPLLGVICKSTKGTPRSGEEELGIALQIGPLPMPREPPLIPSCPNVGKGQKPLSSLTGPGQEGKSFQREFHEKDQRKF